MSFVTARLATQRLLIAVDPEAECDELFVGAVHIEAVDDLDEVQFLATAP